MKEGKSDLEKIKEANLNKRLLDLEKHQKELVNRDEITTSSISELKEKNQHILHETTIAFIKAEDEMELTRSNLQKIKNDATEVVSNLKIVENELTSSRKSLEELFNEHGNRQILSTRINSVKKELLQSEEHLIELKNQLLSIDVFDSSKELSKIETKIQSLHQKKETLIAEKGSAKVQ